MKIHIIPATVILRKILSLYIDIRVLAWEGKLKLLEAASATLVGDSALLYREFG